MLRRPLTQLSLRLQNVCCRAHHAIVPPAPLRTANLLHASLPNANFPYASSPSAKIPHASLPKVLSRAFSSTPTLEAKVKRRKKKINKHAFMDAYSRRLAKARWESFMRRREDIEERRIQALGDPLRGLPEPTAFVKSFDNGLDTTDQAERSRKAYAEVMTRQRYGDTKAATTNLTEAVMTAELLPPQTLPDSTPDADTVNLTHNLSTTTLRSSVQFSSRLTAPRQTGDRSEFDPGMFRRATEEHTRLHKRRVEAIARILAVDNASDRQRTRLNAQRCIDALGRHRTDQELHCRSGELYADRPIAARKSEDSATSEADATSQGADTPVIAATPRRRIGPDTGSSEVQVGILTAKIRVLAARLSGLHATDRINKRNLCLLMHKRQRLLRYIRREDKGGERFQNLIATLGLTPATWEGEIHLR